MINLFILRMPLFSVYFAFPTGEERYSDVESTATTNASITEKAEKA